MDTLSIGKTIPGFEEKLHRGHAVSMSHTGVRVKSAALGMLH